MKAECMPVFQPFRSMIDFLFSAKSKKLENCEIKFWLQVSPPTNFSFEQMQELLIESCLHHIEGNRSSDVQHDCTLKSLLLRYVVSLCRFVKNEKKSSQKHSLNIADNIAEMAKLRWLK